mmetsp:Transcript_119414/g.380846  ORF Transcript_119414/g.380846 Transcript_119414/m.380846 type:complete len:253 (-) Transcript_119414:17-775(-)
MGGRGRGEGAGGGGAGKEGEQSRGRRCESGDGGRGGSPCRGSLRGGPRPCSRCSGCCRRVRGRGAGGCKRSAARRRAAWRRGWLRRHGGGGERARSRERRGRVVGLGHVERLGSGHMVGRWSLVALGWQRRRLARQRPAWAAAFGPAAGRCVGLCPGDCPDALGPRRSSVAGGGLERGSSMGSEARQMDAQVGGRCRGPLGRGTGRRRLASEHARASGGRCAARDAAALRLRHGYQRRRRAGRLTRAPFWGR